MNVSMTGAAPSLQTAVPRRIRVMAVLSLISQILIVGTGGAVRLTGSGLGCPTWPECTAGSFVATPEMGINGAIEFANRLLTFVLIAIAIVTFLFVLRVRRERPELFALALALGLGIPAQGVIGGISVLTGLNPYVVGLHFVVSVLLVALATVLVYRAYLGPRPAARVVPGWYFGIAHATSFSLAVTILVGILTTGSGPHAGDSGAARNGLDSGLLQQLHSWPAYLTFALTVVLVIGALRLRLPRLVRFSGILLAIEFVQIAVGSAQARLGLPELLVGIHMVLAVCLAGAMTAVVLSLRGGQGTSGSEGQQRVDTDREEDQGQVRDRTVEDAHGAHR